jgi:Mn-dependent DtxR family transcriptional regulator
MKMKKATPTANIVHYLLLLLALDEDGSGVRSVDLADRVGVKKPSVYQVIRTLSEKGLAEQERYARVYLTETGRETAALYWDCYNRMLPCIVKATGLREEICRFAVYDILSHMDWDELRAYALAKQRTEGRRIVGAHDLE